MADRQGNSGLPPISDDGSRREHPTPAQTPQVEGYEITGRLGEGGMGTVWKAVQLSTHREVALKLLGGGAISSEKARMRFEREVELAAQLEHPNIARVYDSGLHQGVYYYAMELIDGVHLDEYVETQELTQRQVLELMKTVCQAVQHAHQRGVIHRDLKPSNILVTEGGQPHVLDFGLAKEFLEGEARLTVSLDGDVAGTPAYMSPEQAAGHASESDTRSDVYSLGVILYRLLTGNSPHDLSGTRYEVLRRIAEEAIRRPRNVSKRIDKELEALLLKSLASDSEQRYSTAGELGNDIDNYLTGEPLTAKKPTAAYFLRKWIRKNRVPVSIACVVALVLIAVGVFSYVRVRQERNRALTAETETRKQRDLAESHRKKAVSEAARAIKESQRAEAEAGRATVAAEEAQKQRGAAELGRRQSQERLVTSYVSNGWRLYEQRDLSGALLWHVEALKLAEQINAVSPCSELIEECRIRIGELLQQVPRLRAILPHSSAWHNVQFSSDGRRLLTVSPDHVAHIWDLREPESIRELKLQEEQNDFKGRMPLRSYRITRVDRTHVKLSPDGAYVAARIQDRVRILKVDTGEDVAHLDHVRVHDISFSLNGKWILTCGERSARIWDTKNWGLVTSTDLHGLTYAMFSPDEKSFLTVSGIQNIVNLWDIETGKPTSPDLTLGTTSAPYGNPSCEVACSFSPDGEFLVTVHNPSAYRFSWQAWNIKTGKKTAGVSSRFTDRSVFHPDGKHLLTGGGDAAIYKLSGGEFRQVRLLHHHAPYPFRPSGLHSCLSGDGTRAMVTGSDSAARVFLCNRKLLISNLRRPKFHEPVLSHLDRTHYGTLSHDGRLAAVQTLGDTVRVWDVKVRKRSEDIVVHVSSAVEHKADQEGPRPAALLVHRHLVELPEGGVRVMDTKTGKWVGPPMSVIPRKGYEGKAKLSSDGKHVAIIRERGVQSLSVLDAETGREMTPRLEHKASVLNAVFSPDSSCMLTVCSDGTMWVWNVLTGTPVIGPVQGPKGFGGPAWSSDGRFITTREGGGWRLWNARTGQAITPLIETIGADNDPRAVVQALLLSDGKHVRTTHLRGKSSVSELLVEDRTVEELKLVAQVLSCQRIDKAGISVPLTRKELNSIWLQVKGKYPETGAIEMPHE